MLICPYGKKSILHSTRISEDYKNCTIKVNARWDERAKNYGFGIQFGYKEDEYYTFSISPDGHYKLSHWDGSEWNSLIPWTKTNFIKNGFNNLKVSCLGKNIYAYLNNNLVVNTKIDSFSGGKVGLVCSGDLNASFDDFVIYKN